ncbi:MAG: bifunctional phosphopantothenoylcysteine decarboxylase/phosphopantothenate--cysteine ligase CoaBC [Bacteroidota bacterium]
MGSLQGKKVILGISGSIAAYKSAILTRQLIKAGAEVQVLMTTAATSFITPLTLSTLSKRDVYVDVSSESGWNNHVDIGLWADAMVVAPATATTLAKLAQGIADNMVVATYLSARCPVFFAPAMDLDMWTHPSTRRNVASLLEYGDTLIPVGDGELASGLVGKGRMAEPEEIVGFLEDHFHKASTLKGVRALVTAGPTHEALDPVRFIGNRSTGKMGIAIADALATAGAEVALVLGPTHLGPQHPAVELIRVRSAQEMYEVCIKRYANAQVGVLAAAVADFRPTQISDQKIKKGGNQGMSIELERTPDIAASLGKTKGEKQLLIGFALETNNEEANARGKLARKNFDFIVLNSLRDVGAGFGHDTNRVRFIHANNKQEQFELKSKAAVAKDIVAAIASYLYQK